MTWIIYLVIAAAAIVGTMVAVDHYITQPAVVRGKADGAAEATKKLQPQIDQLTTNLKAAQAVNADVAAKLAGLQKEYADYRAAKDDALARSAAALAKERERASIAAADVKRMAEIMNRPKSTEPMEVVCARANTLADDLISHPVH